ncbi:hypothetical protein AN401_05990 [Zobellella denitrificans]|uniref:SAM-dependent methyltransferase n=2 Tax=Zobellella denitrificans TaxID=347534 RepID=A0A291HMW7_9GAMM|nr:hypothetical protein AN401_05990 [Zobellella denitrificans]
MDFYQQNALSFYRDTVSVDMASLYGCFLPHVAKGGRILDAGCGSGRDARYFLHQGFAVEAFDASPALADLARQLTGLPVVVCRFEEFTGPSRFDAIWACASLLHVPLAKLPGVMAHLTNLLQPDGVFYCSFKYGDGEIRRDGRTFTNMTETGLVRLLTGLPLRLEALWQTGDLRSGREQERWLNALLVKEPS